MKKYLVILLVITCTLFIGCQGKDVKLTQSTTEQVEDKGIKIVDDIGKEIALEKPAKRIISLYSVHTENLYSLGLGEEIIGVGTSDKYPKDVENKQRFSYKDDPELVIAANPDVVIIRNMIANKYPDYVKALEHSGIKVATLYVQKYEEFDSYIERLGVLTGKEDKAEALLKSFHNEIDKIEEKAAKITVPKNVYFESIGKKFKTSTPYSFAGTALKILNTNNIASDVKYDGSTTVVEYGEEKLLSKANEIDVYIAQKGIMNRTVSVEEIKQRPGYADINAIKEDRIIIIDEKLISGATFRYIEGLNSLFESIYNAE